MLQTNVTRACSGHSGFALAHGCVLSPSTLLRFPAARQGAGPELRALPRPKPLRFRFSGTPQKRRLSWACILCLSLALCLPLPEQLRQPGAGWVHSPWVWCAFSPLRPQPHFPPMLVGCMCPVFSCDPPGGCRPSRVSGSLWKKLEACLQCGRGCHLWGQVFPFPLPPASCLRLGWAGLVCSRLALLWTCSDPLFCVRPPAVCSGQLIFSLLLSHSLSCYLTKAPSNCPQGTQAGSLP